MGRRGMEWVGRGDGVGRRGMEWVGGGWSG